MDRRWRTARFTTRLVEDKNDGFAAVELVRQDRGASEVVARVVFWDAEGQYAFEMTSRELPLAIVRELIIEAVATIDQPCD